jgi:hypothetical protein
MALTLGTQFQVDTDGDDLVRFEGLTSTTGIALYSSAASGIEARHLTNTGGTITGGTVLVVDANQADTITICRLTDTTALIGYAYGATHRTRILTVSGTTLSASAVKNMTDTGIDYNTCKLLDTNKVIYCYSNSSLDGVARILSISGTTITENAAFTYYSAFDAHHNSIDVIDTARVVCCWVNSNNNRVTGEILDISGTTITGNAETSTSGFGGSLTGDSSIDVSVQDSFNQVVIVAANGVLTGRRGIWDYSGSTLNTGPTKILNSGGGAANAIGNAYMGNDLNITVINDTGGTVLFISEYNSNTDTSVDTDTSVSTVAGTSSLHVRTLPGSQTAISVWEGTTESITISLASINTFRFLGFDADNANLYASGLKDQATLKLYDYDLATLTESGTASFGSGTETELDEKTRGIFPRVKSMADGELYLYGRDGNNVQVQYNDQNGTLGWQDIGPGTATWGADKYAVALMTAPTYTDDVIAVFSDNDIYRVRAGTSIWTKTGDAGTVLLTAVRHPTSFNRILTGGTAAGTVEYSNNFGASFGDVSGTALGTINAFEVSL